MAIPVSLVFAGGTLGLYFHLLHLSRLLAWPMTERDRRSPFGGQVKAQKRVSIRPDLHGLDKHCLYERLGVLTPIKIVAICTLECGSTGMWA